ncbi:MAG TPA: preprotein translocase subunit YajC [Gaiellaceae bacterium]|jgi:preprotein translocase subunit YajC
MGGAGLFIIVIAFLFLYFVLVRPQKRKQLQQQRLLNEVSVGDEIVTAGGIYGEITAVDEDDVRVRIAPDLEVRVARRAIAGVTTPEPDDAEELEQPDEPDRPEPTPGT